MIETYVSIGKVTDYVIGVLKYFATASSILLISIVGALLAWIFLSAVGMIVAILGIIVATIVLTLGIYELHIQKRRRRYQRLFFFAKITVPFMKNRSFERSKRSMDEMRIVSKFTRGIISKAIKMVIRKKTGYNIDIQLNEAITTISDGKTHLHLDVDAELDKDELMSILKSIGLN